MRVNDRDIALKKRADGVAWFEFAALCEGPRSVAELHEIARSYNNRVISQVTQFTALNDDAAKRFVHLVDEFYDRNVNLACRPPRRSSSCTRACACARSSRAAPRGWSRCRAPSTSRASTARDAGATAPRAAALAALSGFALTLALFYPG